MMLSVEEAREWLVRYLYTLNGCNEYSHLILKLWYAVASIYLEPSIKGNPPMHSQIDWDATLKRIKETIKQIAEESRRNEGDLDFSHGDIPSDLEENDNAWRYIDEQMLVMALQHKELHEKYLLLKLWELNKTYAYNLMQPHADFFVRKAAELATQKLNLDKNIWHWIIDQFTNTQKPIEPRKKLISKYILNVTKSDSFRFDNGTLNDEPPFFNGTVCYRVPLFRLINTSLSKKTVSKDDPKQTAGEQSPSIFNP